MIEMQIIKKMELKGAPTQQALKYDYNANEIEN